MKRLIRLTTLVLAAVALAAPSLAQAASSTCQAYNPQLSSVTACHKADAGTLPFTGLDIVLLIGGGGALVLAGLVIRRLSRQLS